MERFLGPYSQYIGGITRILVGLMFASHGAQKLFGVFGGAPAEMPAVLLWSAGIIELVGGLLVALGLFAGYAAFICSGQMAVAYFLVHQPQGLLPIVNRGELAVIYTWVFLFIAAQGPGAWSLQSVLGLGRPSGGGS